MVPIIRWPLFLSRWNLLFLCSWVLILYSSPCPGWGENPSSFRVHKQPERVRVLPICRGSAQTPPPLGSGACFLLVPEHSVPYKQALSRPVSLPVSLQSPQSQSKPSRTGTRSSDFLNLSQYYAASPSAHGLGESVASHPSQPRGKVCWTREVNNLLT